jgi:hypothetical protein
MLIAVSGGRAGGGGSPPPDRQGPLRCGLLAPQPLLRTLSRQVRSEFGVTPGSSATRLRGRRLLKISSTSLPAEVVVIGPMGIGHGRSSFFIDFALPVHDIGGKFTSGFGLRIILWLRMRCSAIPRGIGRGRGCQQGSM